MPHPANPVTPFVQRELQRADIEALIPHRHDFLFVKSIQLLTATRFQSAVRWAADQAGIEGHFPGEPIVPAVFIVEVAAQIAGAGLLAAGQTAIDATRIGVFAAIRRCTFTKPVFPSQAVQFDIQVERATAGFIAVKGEATVANEPVASVEFVIALAPKALVFAAQRAQPQNSPRVAAEALP